LEEWPPPLTTNDYSVVQRQMWLMVHGRRLKDKTYQPEDPYNHSELSGHPPSSYRRISKNEAYDLARKELYNLRHMEQVEQRIANEEATYTGAYFGPSRLDISMKIEDNIWEGWKAWAEKEMVAMEEATKVGGVPQQSPPAPAETPAEPRKEAASRGPGGPTRGVLRDPTIQS
jgi:hypothetical protein